MNKCKMGAKYKLMEKREFQKILADSLLNIVEVGIKKGYFK